MPYQGTDRQAELKTLQEELAHTKKRLYQTRSKEAWPVILSHIRQIKRDILRNTANKLV